jgi:UPF0716 protein FxsA
VFVLALIVWVAAEIAAFVAVAQQIGVLLAVILVLGISTAGPWLIRRAGIGVIDHARARMARGEVPDVEVLDGVVLLLGGALVLVPGFIGDVIGLLLLFAPVRHLVIRFAGRHLVRQVGAGALGTWGSGRSGTRWSRPGPVIEAPTHNPGHQPDAGPAGRDSGGQLDEGR